MNPKANMRTDKMLRACYLCALVITTVPGATGHALANESAELFLQRESVRDYIRQITKEHNLNPNRVAGLFVKLKRQQSILDAISRPAERTLSWREYRPIFLTQKRIDEGRTFLARHEDLLLEAQSQFGVPAEIITAIIGVETFYGRIAGSYGVLEALATLAFDYPRRTEFFTNEMTEFILLSAAEGWDTVNIKGSYAGAMGMPQFIASSYRQYAIDFDADGKRDLFNSPADIIGSVANYLAIHGWVEGAPIAERWIPDEGITEEMLAMVRESLIPVVGADTIKSLGFDSPLLDRGTPGRQLLSVMTMDVEQGQELWIGYKNFYAITRYNHSRLYAMAVFQLAQAIRAS